MGRRSKMNKLKALGQLRHALTFLGGIAVAYGYLDESSIPELSGAIITIVGFVWSFIAPEKKA